MFQIVLALLVSVLYFRTFWLTKPVEISNSFAVSYLCLTAGLIFVLMSGLLDDLLAVLLR
jgi:hypothetical protein